MSVWTIPVALCAAACFAVATALQHRGAGGVTAAGRWWLLRLARRPGWIAGVLVAGVGFVLHATALRLGALAVVQPLLVSGVVFALPVRAALERRAPTLLSLLWATVTAAGLALFLVALAPTPGRPSPDTDASALFAVIGVTVAAVAAGIGARFVDGRLRALLLGFGGGVLFGVTAGMVKTYVTDLHGFGDALGAWPLYVVVVVGPCGLALNQWAYRAAPLAVSMPVLNATSPIVATLFGAVVFAEMPDVHPVALVLQVTGFVVMIAGVAALVRHVTVPRRSPRAGATPGAPESHADSRHRCIQRSETP